MSYIVPTNELTLTDIKAYKSAAIQAGIDRAMALGLARKDTELVVRHALPLTDFPNGWVIEQYRNPAIAAAGWGSVFDAGALPAFAPALANTKVAVFYKVAVYTAGGTNMQGVRFRVGGTGATTKATFFFQLETNAKLEPDVYFSEPVVYDPTDVVYIEAYYNGITGALGEGFAFGCYIVERLGANVS